MHVKVNGKARNVKDGATISALLDDLGLNRDGIAVAVDRKVVPRSVHPSTVLNEGASVEVIRAVGGG